MLYQISLFLNIICAMAGTASSFLFWIWCLSKCTNTKKKNLLSTIATSTDSGPVVLFDKPITPVTLKDLILATGNFNMSNIINFGRAWIGPSYKAALSDGSELIVQCLRPCTLSEHAFRVNMVHMSHVRHPNLVPLLGFSILRNEQRLLLYKYMRNGTLSCQLSTQPDWLDWPTRLRIAIGGARGLAWLHHGMETPLVHGHITSNAILLDDSFDARILEFVLQPLANICPTMNDYLDELIYTAPECARVTPTTKGDVYAFGIVMLELVTGKKPVVEATDEVDWCKLVDWVNHVNTLGCISHVIDRSLRGKGHDDEIVRFLMIVICCLAIRPEERLSMCKLYKLLVQMAGEENWFEYFDEFPLLYRLDE